MGLLDFQGRRGITSAAWWGVVENPSLVQILLHIVCFLSSACSVLQVPLEFPYRNLTANSGIAPFYEKAQTQLLRKGCFASFVGHLPGHARGHLSNLLCLVLLFLGLRANMKRKIKDRPKDQKANPPSSSGKSKQKK